MQAEEQITELSPELTEKRKHEFEDVDRYLAERRKASRADDEAWSPEMRARMIANSQRYEAAELLKQLAGKAEQAFGTAVLNSAARHLEGE